MMLLRPKGLLGTYEIPFLRAVLPKRRKREANATSGVAQAPAGTSTGEGG